MWTYVVRRLLYNVPVYLGIIALMMAMLRVRNPVMMFLGKSATEEQIADLTERIGLARPFFFQYLEFLGQVFTLNFSQESWQQPGKTVGDLLSDAIVPTLWITVPSLIITAGIAIAVGLVSAFFRGRALDKSLVLVATLGMCISYLVYIIFGQYFGAYKLNDALAGEGPFDGKLFAIESWEPGFPGNWIHFCLLPVIINVVVAMGYDTRFYRAVMVEESTRDYITTAKAKGASKRKVMFVHMLKNAMIPIITRVMTTLPFLFVGSVLLESYFNIPGMGRELLTAINELDFPVTQTFTAVFAALFIVTNVLTDVLYALVDPRVRLS